MRAASRPKNLKTAREGIVFDHLNELHCFGIHVIIKDGVLVHQHFRVGTLEELLTWQRR